MSNTKRSPIDDNTDRRNLCREDVLIFRLNNYKFKHKEKQVKTVIYLDMLFLQGVIINYALLLCAAQLSAVNFKRRQIILAAVFGGVASFIIFLPTPPAILQATIKLLITALIILVAFKSNARGYLKIFLWYILVNCLLAGLLLLFRLAGGEYTDNNMQVYFDISAVMLIATIVIIYLAINLIKKIFPSHDTAPLELNFNYKERNFTLNGRYDSGFAAQDILQNAPLILVGLKNSKKYLPDELVHSLENYFSTGMPNDGLSILPLTGVGGLELTATLFPVTVVVNNKEARDVKLCFSKNAIELGGASCLVSKEFMEVLNHAHKAVITE